MTTRIGTVVVLGGSAAGMLAAAAASRHAERVIVVERDALGGGIAPRKGVPQGRHNHNLLAGGREIVERLLPGFTDALIARGGFAEDSGLAARWTIAGHRLARAATGHLGVFASRPCMDDAMLERLRAQPGLELRDRTDVLGLAVEAGRVVGVRTTSRDDDAGERTIAVDLVIDATGRGSRLPAWLEALGHAPAPTDEVEVRVAYATRTFRRREGELGDLRALVVSGTAPDRARGGVAFAIEGERWTVLLYGYGGTRPPLDLEGFRAYAATLVDPAIAELVQRAEPLDEGVAFSYPRAVRRRLDRASVPPGVIAIGDALVSTNPCWGSGMTSAALMADALDRMLARGVPQPRRWHAEAIRASDPVWRSTTSNDLAYACVEGAPAAPMRMLRRYLGAVCAGGVEDPVLARAMIDLVDRVAGPGSLLAPAIAGRVLSRALRAPAAPAPSRMLGA